MLWIAFISLDSMRWFWSATCYASREHAFIFWKGRVSFGAKHVRVCPECRAQLPEFGAETPRCESCGFAAVERDGFLHWAPELAGGNLDYDADFFRKLAPLEEKNWWFVGRNRMIQSAVRRLGSPGSFLEIGCGTGFVLKGLADAFP